MAENPALRLDKGINLTTYLSKKRGQQMPYIKKEIRAGKTIEVEKYFTGRYHKKGCTRGENKKPTPEKMAQINERNAEKTLRHLLNTNFSPGDLHLTLTYRKDARPDPEGSRKELEKYMRKLRTLYKKRESELKYITVTEYKSKAVHHHLVINMVNNISGKELNDLWINGRTRFTYLDESGQYGALAHYLIKETRKTYQEKGSPSGKRWNPSRNLKKPIVKKEIVKAKEWRKNPEPKKGYMLEKDSIQEGFHDFNGWPYQKYSMVKVPERKRC
jgi:hypothetical protein